MIDGIIVPGVYMYRMEDNASSTYFTDTVRIDPIGGIVAKTASTVTVQIYEFDTQNVLTTTIPCSICKNISISRWNNSKCS